MSIILTAHQTIILILGQNIMCIYQSLSQSLSHVQYSCAYGGIIVEKYLPLGVSLSKEDKPAWAVIHQVVERIVPIQAIEVYRIIINISASVLIVAELSRGCNVVVISTKSSPLNMGSFNTVYIKILPVKINICIIINRAFYYICLIFYKRNLHIAQKNKLNCSSLLLYKIKKCLSVYDKHQIPYDAQRLGYYDRKSM
ncbi:hypothetical protein BDB01DRAFT_839536 [Pilobolus umbonatus]|nr:hypothetical protein BDB01DRAFT_839536 [Pilobolus umbonatus]